MLLTAPSLRPALQNGKTLLGTFCELPCAEAVEVCGLAGWDFVLLDCEHAPIGTADIPSMVRAASAAGVPIVVRVPSLDAAAIQHALDAGASGVQIPQIASVAEARAAVDAARFHPLGSRGLNPYVRASGFSSESVAEFVRDSNEHTTLVLQIESAAGIAGIDEIVQLGGIDVLFVGPYDMSQSLGIPGEITNRLVWDAGSRIIAAAKTRGVAVGVYASTAENARRWIELGARYVCWTVDTVVLLEAMRAALNQLRP